MTTDEKVRENRLRRVADRRGLILQKSRRRDPFAIGYGTYTLSEDPETGEFTVCANLDEVDRYLNPPTKKRARR